MAIKIVSTRQAALESGLKILVHGLAGAGKTRLIATLPRDARPLVINAEGGLLSLADRDFDSVRITDMEEMQEVYAFCAGSADAKQYDWICIDSVSEIAEVVLATEKARAGDPRQAYGALNDQMAGLVKGFRNLPFNVYMTAKQERIKDEYTGQILYQPSAPGRSVGPSLPYLFDEVFALRVEKDNEGNPTRWLQTFRDVQYDAKDRSGQLDPFEPYDLAAIVSKIRGAHVATPSREPGEDDAEQQATEA